MDVSIGIITWNSKDLLTQLLDSIRSNAGDLEYEIVVVDNHSEDGSIEAVSPSRVFACQPDRVSCSDGTATAHKAGPATITFHYQLPPERRAELQAVCYVTVVSD